MADDHIRYDILTQDALRGVLRKVLAEVARTGLPGEHHFFITFATHAPGVRISSRLLARYPEDMTIVLQHQYWDLTVNENAFEVGLSFNGIPERLLVPFTAVKIFQDPSVPFGVQFEVATKPGEPKAERPRALEVVEEEPSAEDAAEAEAKAPEPDTRPIRIATAEKAPVGKSEGEKPDAVEKEKPESDEVDRPAAGDAQVVSLDAFRKKS
jgi:hypothetical protein